MLASVAERDTVLVQPIIDPDDLARLPIDDLFARALVEIRDEEQDTPVPCLVALHDRPTGEVFDVAASLLTSPDPLRRELGARVLRELGRQGDDGRLPFGDQAIPLLRDRLGKESDPHVLGWLVSALSYNGAREALAGVLRFVDHPDGFVRFHVAAELPYLTDPDQPDPAVVAALRQLSGDSDPETRYYALYALVSELSGLDPEQISQTIAERLTDPDDEVRALAHERRCRMRPTGSTPSEATPTTAPMAEPAGGLHDWLQEPETGGHCS